jgi:hypothetical protein
MCAGRWYNYGPPNITDEEITGHISKAMKTRLKHERFEFVWYQNPKMTIPEIFHVQVFWHVLPP